METLYFIQNGEVRFALFIYQNGQYFSGNSLTPKTFKTGLFKTREEAQKSITGQQTC